MHQLFTTLFVLISFALQAQDPALDISLLDNWDPDTLPSASGVDYNEVWGYTDCQGREFAIIGSAAFIHFHEVSNPTDIREIASFAGGQNTIWRDMKTYKDRAYAVSDNTSEGLMIFDLSQLPDTVTKTYHSNAFFNKSHNIFIDEQHGRLYAAGTNASDMLVFDIATDPDDPILLGSPSLEGGGYVHDVYVRDNIAYCSHGYDGFYVWDFTDPQNPIRKAHVVTGGYNHSSWLTDDGRYAIFAEEVPIGQPLGVIDLTNVNSGEIEIVNTFKFPLLSPTNDNNRPHNPFIRGQYAIVSYYHDGLQIINFSDPLNPTLDAYYDTHDNTAYSGYAGAWGTYPFLPSGNLLVSDMTRGLFVLSADSINLAPVEVDSDPEVLIEISGSNPFCIGDTLQLTIAEGADQYQWYDDAGPVDGATTNSLAVDLAGNYWVTASNGRCENTSMVLAASSIAKPDLSQLLSGEFSLCQGESLWVQAPDTFDSYLWGMDDIVFPTDSSAFEITEPGTYYLSVLYNGCDATSAPITVEFKALPDVSLSISDSVFCQGTPIELEVPAGADSYEWFIDGFSVGVGNYDHIVETMVGGTYYVVVTKDDCSNTSESFELVFNIPIIPMISATGNTLSSSSAQSYQWHKNGAIIAGADQPSYEATESANYVVAVIDQNGCAATSEPYELIITSSKLLAQIREWTITPNPVGNQLQLDLQLVQAQAIRISIVDLMGREVLSIPNFAGLQLATQIDVSTLSEGVYFVKIENDWGMASQKFVKE